MVIALYCILNHLQNGQVLRQLAAAVHLADAAHLLQVQGIESSPAVLVFVSIVHEAFENIRFHHDGHPVLCSEFLGVFWEVREGFHVGIQLVVQAALQAAALTG
jgi:hypothetical protein